MKESKNSNSCSGQSSVRRSTTAAHDGKTSGVRSQKKQSDTKAAHSGSRSTASTSRSSKSQSSASKK